MPPKKLEPHCVLFQKRTKLMLGKKIYEGGFPLGEIYRLDKYPNRLVKIVNCPPKMFKASLNTLKYLYKQNNSAVVKIYRIGYFTSPKLLTYNGEKKKYYYYIMDRLRPVPVSIRDNIWRIENGLMTDRYRTKSLEHIPHEKARAFVKNARKLKCTHHDIHEGNVMSSRNGSLKFIDLESFVSFR